MAILYTHTRQAHRLNEDKLAVSTDQDARQEVEEEMEGEGGTGARLHTYDGWEADQHWIRFAVISLQWLCPAKGNVSQLDGNHLSQHSGVAAKRKTPTDNLHTEPQCTYIPWEVFPY